MKSFKVGSQNIINIIFQKIQMVNWMKNTCDDFFEITEFWKLKFGLCNKQILNTNLWHT